MDKEKKVLFVLDTLGVGGAEISVVELVKHITQFQVSVCVIYKSSHELLDQLISQGINVKLLQIEKRFGFLEAVLKLRKVLKEEKPDIVHANHFRSEIISRIIVPFFKIPLLGTLISDSHSRERYELVSRRERLKLEIYRYMNKVTVFRCNFFLSVSNSIVEPNIKYLNIPKNKISVIPNGRDITKYLNIQPIKRELINNSIGPNDILIVSNSRVIKSKGFDEIFKAFRILTKKFNNLYLIIVGDGYDFEKYKEFCSKLRIQHKVVFLGSRLDMAEILKACDIFWFASHYEGSPGVIIEGMLSKLPIIASNISPVTENLIHGKNSLLFEMGSEIDLTCQTEFLLQNWEIKDSLVNNSFQLALEKFDIKKIALMHEDIYQSIINREL